MSDRQKLQEELNRINQLYHETDLEMRKAGGSTEQRQMLRDLLNKKKQQLEAELGDSLQKLNAGKAINVGKGTVSKIDDLGVAKAVDEARLGKFAKTLGKKAAGIIPLAGVGMAALQGDPAMAAEELAEDVAGPLALMKPDVAGDVQGQNELEAEIQARKNYKKSPAALDAEKKRFKKLKGFLG